MVIRVKFHSINVVQLGSKLNTKIALNHHHHPSGTFRPVPDIVGDQDLVCLSSKGPGPKNQDQTTMTKRLRPKDQDKRTRTKESELNDQDQRNRTKGPKKSNAQKWLFLGQNLF